MGDRGRVATVAGLDGQVRFSASLCWAGLPAAGNLPLAGLMPPPSPADLSRAPCSRPDVGQTQARMKVTHDEIRAGTAPVAHPRKSVHTQGDVTGGRAGWCARLQGATCRRL